MEVHKGTAAANYRKVSAMIEQLCVCVFIPSPVMEGSTLLGDDGGSILSNRAETSQER